MLRECLVSVALLGAIGTSASAGRVVLNGVNVIPMDREVILADRSVIMEGGVIKSVVKRSDFRAAVTDRVIDLHGKYVIPGLWDAHVHLQDDSDAPLFVCYGVTHVRNMDGYSRVLKMRKRIGSGELLGPEILTTGPRIVGAGSEFPGALMIVTETGDVPRIVAAHIARGDSAVKVYEGLSERIYRALVSEAQERGLSVWGHLPKGIGLEVGLRVGQDSIEHMTGWAEAINLHTGANHETRIRLRELAALAQAGGVAHTPTLVAIRAGWGNETSLRLPSSRYVSRYRVESWKRVWASNHLVASVREPMVAASMKTTRFYERAIRELVSAGALVLAGTDVGLPGIVPGASLHRELLLLVKAGLSPYESLACATLFCGKAMKRDGMGVIRPGSPADLVVLDGNPLEDITRIGQVRAVVLRGKFLSRADLDGVLAELIETQARAVPWWGKNPPTPNLKVKWTARYAISWDGFSAGQEQLVVGQRDGKLVAQSYREIPFPWHVQESEQAVFDDSGRVVEYWVTHRSDLGAYQAELRLRGRTLESIVHKEGAEPVRARRVVEGTTLIGPRTMVGRIQELYLLSRPRKATLVATVVEMSNHPAHPKFFEWKAKFEHVASPHGDKIKRILVHDVRWPDDNPTQTDVSLEGRPIRYSRKSPDHLELKLVSDGG